MPSQPRQGYVTFMLWMPEHIKTALRCEAARQTDSTGRHVSMSELVNDALAARFSTGTISEPTERYHTAATDRTADAERRTPDPTRSG